MQMLEDRVNAMDIFDGKVMLQLAQDGSDDGRALLAQTVSRFFERELKDSEKDLAGGILMQLVRQAEIDLREALAERLALNPGVPRELIVFLAHDDEISVASPVLMHSPVLGDDDLLAVIAAKGACHWQAIARREQALSQAVSEKLISTGDATTVLRLLENRKADLPRRSFRRIARISLGAEDLHKPLLSRPEIDAELATDIFLCVSEALRSHISERFRISPAMLDKALESLVTEMAGSVAGTQSVTGEMESLARKFAERGEITTDLLIRTLRRGQYAFFSALFARRLNVESGIALRILMKDGGRPLAVACRHLGVLKPEFATLFLLSRGIRKGDKVVDQSELAQALRNFDLIKARDATIVMQSWMQNPEMI